MNNAANTAADYAVQFQGAGLDRNDVTAEHMIAHFAAFGDALDSEDAEALADKVRSLMPECWTVRNADTTEPIGSISGDNLARYIDEAGIVTPEMADRRGIDANYEGVNSGIVAGDDYGFPGVTIYCQE